MELTAKLEAVVVSFRGTSNGRPAGEDTFGLYLIPHYDLTDRLQLVGRYAYASQARMHRPQRAAHTEQAIGCFQDDRPNLEDVQHFLSGSELSHLRRSN